MAATSSYMASTKFSMSGPIGGYLTSTRTRHSSSSSLLRISAQQQPSPPQVQEAVDQEPQFLGQDDKTAAQKPPTPLRPVEVQRNVKSKNMGREYGGQWLSSTTRHVRIFAAYIDPVTCEFDQTQMDKLTLILDPTNEFVWNPDTCNKVYSYFQELVDHYEGAPLTEYTLRLIGSDIEHYIRKLLYDGEIKYNMNARVLNFSMGKPRILFKNMEETKLEDV